MMNKECEISKMAFVHHESQKMHEIGTRSLYNSGYTNIYHQRAMD